MESLLFSRLKENHNRCLTACNTCAIFIFMTWLILIHQIPAKPSYFRAKIWRRLHQIGSIPIKQAVYAMPNTDQCLEDLSWIAKEIKDQGGEAIILNASLLEGLTDDQVVHLFKKARQVDYGIILEEARSFMDAYHSEEMSDPVLLDYKAGLRKLIKSFAATVNIDFFPLPEQAQTEAYLDEMETIFHRPKGKDTVPVAKGVTFSGCTWVTKCNVYVDRMASAWLIKRFIDNTASFKFLKKTHYQPSENELRFDMREAEYTHQGDMCTFEVLAQTFCPQERGLKQIAKLIHDIDLKEDSFALPETAGIHAILDSIVATTSDDHKRIELASTIFDGLLTNYSTKK